MDEHIDQLKLIFDVTYLTLIVKIDGTYLIGMFTKQYMDSYFKQYDGYYIIDNALMLFGEYVSLFLKSTYKIPKKEPLKFELQEKDTFLKKYGSQLNYKASCIANHFDRNNMNYIIGDCAFIFDNDTLYTENKLKELLTRIPVIPNKF